MPPRGLRPDMTTGERISIWRQYRGITQEAAAGLVGKSLSWWKKVESGTRTVERVSDLVLIAQVLHVHDLSDLTGALEISMRMDRTREHPLLGSMRAAMYTAQLPLLDMDEPPAPPTDAATLKRRLDMAWEMWHQHTMALTEVGALIPDLLIDTCALVRATEDPSERRRAALMQSEAYLLAAYWGRYSAQWELAWTAADRALTAAHESGDRTAIALAGWKLSGISKDLGRVEEAMEISQRAAAVLAPVLQDGTDAQRSVWGHIQLQNALNSAHMTETGAAMRYWDAGQAMANRLGERHTGRITVFGVPNVGRFAVRVNVALGQFRAAREAAERLDMETVPSAALRAWGWIDVARAYAARREDVASCAMLSHAWQTSPETVSHSPWARELIRDLIRRDNKTIAAEVRALARNTHVVGSGTL